MPNTSVPAAAEGVPGQQFSVAALETPIENARRMASIVSRMATEMIGGNRFKWPGKQDVYHFTRQQCDDLLFAVYHSEEMADTIREVWEPMVALDSAKRQRPEHSDGAVTPEDDPLLVTIRAYLAGLVDFEANHPRDDDAGTNAYADKTYGPHLARIFQWDEPARTRQGALAALRLCVDDVGGVAGCEGADRMVRAAIGFLEAQR